MDYYFYSHPQADELSTSFCSLEPFEGVWLVETEDTLFYPGGGGQPADRGSINNQEVLGVRKEGRRILHLCRDNPGKGKAHMVLDRPYRDHFVAQHSGQHLISSLLHRLFNRPTLSVHLGEEVSTIELGGEILREEELEALEEAVNQEIRRNLPIDSTMVPSAEDLQAYTLRRPAKQSRDIRLVRIGDVDTTPCGGLHCSSTGEIGLVKYVGLERIRGNYRLKWKIAGPAYQEFRSNFSVLEGIAGLFSVRKEEALGAVQKLIQQKEELQRALISSWEKEATEMAEALLEGPAPLNCHLGEERPELFRMLLKRLSRDKPFFLTMGGDPFRWALYLPGPQGAELYEALKAEKGGLIKPQGGGCPPLWQGSAQGGREPFLGLLREFVRQSYLKTPG